MSKQPASPMDSMPWEFMETDDWQWFNATTFGSGVARAVALCRPCNSRKGDRT